MERAPYTANPANVKKLFSLIKTLGDPNKVNQGWLKQVGFKSSNDRPLVSVLRFLRFIDNNGVPQKDMWRPYKDKARSALILAESLRHAYDELFSTYPDAQDQSSETIQNFFVGKWGVSARVAQLMEQTFKNLCGLADFEGVRVPEPSTPTVEREPQRLPELGAPGRAISVNINIELHLPATDDATIYDSLFAALKKHLYS